MTKPLVVPYLGGSIKIVQKGDEYKDPSGSVKQYEKAKIMIAHGGAKQAFELPKEAWDTITEKLHDPDVQKKLQDWE